MSTEKIVELAIRLGYKVDEYENHICLSNDVEVSFKLVLPKATYIHETIVEFVKKMLGL